jgi:polysaccharide biosynthesis protein PslH
MRALFLTPQLPYPPYSGGPLRNYGLLYGLHEAGFTLDLLTFTQGHTDSAPTPLTAICRQIMSAPAPTRSKTDRLRTLLSTSQADLLGRYQSEAYAQALSKCLASEQYDLIQLEGLELAGYLPQLLAYKQSNPQVRLVYDAHNAEYQLQRRIFEVDRRNPALLPAAAYSYLQWRRLAALERAVCHQVDNVIAVSEEDAAALGSLAPQAKITVIANGISLGDYSESSEQLNLGGAALLFTGTMDYRPNVDAVLWFVDSVLDLVREAVPNTRLFVVGNRPHPRLERVRRRGDVEITGFVQDITPFLHSATVFVAPLRMGSGTRLKLLQAMAAGCAIVSTPLGAGGISVDSGREMILAEEATAFAQAVVGLLRDGERRQALGAAARALVERHYDWKAILPRLLGVYGQNAAATG